MSDIIVWKKVEKSTPIKILDLLLLIIFFNNKNNNNDEWTKKFENLLFPIQKLYSKNKDNFGKCEMINYLSNLTLEQKTKFDFRISFWET